MLRAFEVSKISIDRKIDLRDDGRDRDGLLVFFVGVILFRVATAVYFLTHPTCHHPSRGASGHAGKFDCSISCGI